MTEAYLYAYDITNGFAKTLSTEINGIFMTTIVVFENEYYYGNGICCSKIGTTPFGPNPIEKISLGKTEVIKDLFDEFLSFSVKRFEWPKFDIRTFNCNDLSDELSFFLRAVGIDKKKYQVPDKSHPIWEKLNPVVNAFLQILHDKSEPIKPVPLSMEMPAIEDLKIAKKVNDAAPISIGDYKQVTEINSNAQLQDFISKNIGVIIDFWSPSCGPCMQLRPIFHQLAEHNMCTKIKLCSVNVQAHSDIAGFYNVSSIPHLLFIHMTQPVETVIGNNPQALNDAYERLRSKIEDTHPHFFIAYTKFQPFSKECVKHEDLKQKAGMVKAMTGEIGKSPKKNDLGPLLGWIQKDNLNISNPCSEKAVDNIFMILQDINSIPGKIAFVDCIRIIGLWHKNATNYLIKQYWEKLCELLVNPGLESLKNPSTKKMGIFLLSVLAKAVANILSQPDIYSFIDVLYHDIVENVILKLSESAYDQKDAGFVYSSSTMIHNLMLVTRKQPKTIDDKYKMLLIQKIVSMMKDSNFDDTTNYNTFLALARLIYCASKDVLSMVKSLKTDIMVIFGKYEKSSNENVKRIIEDLKKLIEAAK